MYSQVLRVAGSRVGLLFQVVGHRCYTLPGSDPVRTVPGSRLPTAVFLRIIKLPKTYQQKVPVPGMYETNTFFDAGLHTSSV